MKLVFLGKLADLADGGERQLEAAVPLDWAALLARIGGPLAETLGGEKVRVACNGAVLPDKQTLVAAPDDEIAFLPPVSGG